MTNTLFAFNPAISPDVEDDEYVLLTDMEITVQVCAFGGATTFAVCEHGGEGEDFYVQYHGEFPALESAQAKAIQVARCRKAK